MARFPSVFVDGEEWLIHIYEWGQAEVRNVKERKTYRTPFLHFSTIGEQRQHFIEIIKDKMRRDAEATKVKRPRSPGPVIEWWEMNLDSSYYEDYNWK